MGKGSGGGHYFQNNMLIRGLFLATFYMTLTIAVNRYLLASCLLATFIRSPPSSLSTSSSFKKGNSGPSLSFMCSFKITLDSAVRS